MTRLPLTLILVLSALFLAPLAPDAAAQDIPPGCTPDMVAVNDLLAEAQTAFEDGDLETYLDLSNQALNELASQRAACLGLAFSGDADDIIGPLVIQPGEYITTLEGQISVDVTSLDDDFLCTKFAFVASDEESVREVWDFSEECRVLIEVEQGFGESGEWTLTLAPID